jgi:trimethylamine:corrinoid methyltransferase-like protein
MNNDDVYKIHMATIEVLERIGVIVENDNVLYLLEKAGAHIEKSYEKQRFPNIL